MKGIFIYGLLGSSLSYAQQLPKDSIQSEVIQTVTITKKLPVTKEIVNVQQDLSNKNLGQDLPFLLKNQTSVISTSDAGNGVGYTGFQIRGVGGKSINVMLNGVPYNDSESQGTFFVNLPDISSAASQIEIQRGVGASTTGMSAFGASVNIITKEPEKEFYFKTDDSYGSFNTQKYSAELGTGLFWKSRLSLMGRYSLVHSDGYRERANSDLSSYFFTAMYNHKKTSLQFMSFGGKEKTYQSWNPIDRATWEKNPTYNPSGAIYDANGKITGYYHNETDNYQQYHNHLVWRQRLGEQWKLETTLHYTRGKGYYNNYKSNASFSQYHLPKLIIDGSLVEASDLIREKWLDNDFYGVISSLNGTLKNLNLNFGIAANQYYGRHYGNVSGVQYPWINEHEYYRNNALKNDWSGYARALWKIHSFELFGDVQLRNITYKTNIVQAGDGKEELLVDKNWTFFNPKAGVNYLFSGGKLYFSYAQSQREPSRSDLQPHNGIYEEVNPEKLNDFELGFEKKFQSVQLLANAYYMKFVDQLVYTGEMDDVGALIRRNSGNSYRMGLEVGLAAQLSKQWKIAGNFTWSKNKNKKYTGILNGQIVNLENTPISFSPNFIGNFSIDYTPFNHWSLGLQNHYVSKQYLDNTHNQDRILDAYFLTDFNMVYTLELYKAIVDFKFLLNNLFNNRYFGNGAVEDGTAHYFPQAGINYMFGMTLQFK